MKAYDKIIISLVSTSSSRMLIGAVSTLYMLVSGLTIYDVGIIKGVQAVLIFIFGLFVGIVSDRLNRKTLHIIALAFSTLWLYLFYLGGKAESFELFLWAEILNAISLSLYQNNSNAYLVDQFYKDRPNDMLNEAFGKLGKFEFLFMAIASLLGGVLYYWIAEKLFILTVAMMLAILIFSIVFLPSIKPHKSKDKGVNFINKIEFLILGRKFRKYRAHIILFILLGIYFQIIIQYWQAMLYEFNHVANNEFILGGVLFLMFMVQSFAGKIIEHKYKVNQVYMAVALIASMVLAISSTVFSSILLYTVSLCLMLFIIRYTMITTDVLLHAHLLSRFRAKYDMLLNSILRVFTAVILIVVGYLSELVGIQMINWFGLAVSFVFFWVILNNRKASRI